MITVYHLTASWQLRTPLQFNKHPYGLNIFKLLQYFKAWCGCRKSELTDEIKRSAAAVYAHTRIEQSWPPVQRFMPAMIIAWIAPCAKCIASSVVIHTIRNSWGLSETMKPNTQPNMCMSTLVTPDSCKFGSQSGRFSMQYDFNVYFRTCNQSTLECVALTWLRTWSTSLSAWLQGCRISAPFPNSTLWPHSQANNVRKCCIAANDGAWPDIPVWIHWVCLWYVTDHCVLLCFVLQLSGKVWQAWLIPILTFLFQPQEPLSQQALKP